MGYARELDSVQTTLRRRVSPIRQTSMHGLALARSPRLPQRIAGSDLGMFGLETAVRWPSACVHCSPWHSLTLFALCFTGENFWASVRVRPFLASMISLTRTRSLARWLAGWSCCKNKESEGEREGGEEFIHRQA